MQKFIFTRGKNMNDLNRHFDECERNMRPYIKIHNSGKRTWNMIDVDLICLPLEFEHKLRKLKGELIIDEIKRALLPLIGTHKIDLRRSNLLAVATTITLYNDVAAEYTEKIFDIFARAIDETRGIVAGSEGELIRCVDVEYPKGFMGGIYGTRKDVRRYEL